VDEACYQYKIRKRLHPVQKYLGSFNTNCIVFRNVGIFKRNKISKEQIMKENKEFFEIFLGYSV
jgi:hypothetical protein